MRWSTTNRSGFGGSASHRSGLRGSTTYGSCDTWRGCGRGRSTTFCQVPSKTNVKFFHVFDLVHGKCYINVCTDIFWCFELHRDILEVPNKTAFWNHRLILGYTTTKGWAFREHTNSDIQIMSLGGVLRSPLNLRYGGLTLLNRYMQP